MRPYTRTGDKQTTALIGHKRKNKSSLRVDCYGTCDEALAFIGLSYNYIDNDEIKAELEKIMQLIFKMNRDLANPDQVIPYEITAEHAQLIETYIDRMDDQLEPLTDFLLPINSLAASYVNVVRTIIRRAERKIVGLSEVEEINNNVLPFINRLSDYFFVLERYLNKLAGFKGKII